MPTWTRFLGGRAPSDLGAEELRRRQSDAEAALKANAVTERETWNREYAERRRNDLDKKIAEFRTKLIAFEGSAAIELAKAAGLGSDNIWSPMLVHHSSAIDFDGFRGFRERTKKVSYGDHAPLTDDCRASLLSLVRTLAGEIPEHLEFERFCDAQGYRFYFRHNDSTLYSGIGLFVEF